MTDRGTDSTPYVFPKWANVLRPALALSVIGLPLYLTLLVTFGFSARTLNVGYAPEQPVPYSHALHVGELGMDCRYCHSTVERSRHAAIPPTETCMNCHTRIRAQSEKLAAVRVSAETGEPIPWVRVHDLPEYVYFNHESHVSAGVSCVSCHGRVDTMEVVRTVQPLSMSWCLDCHRNPDPHLRPLDRVTDLAWEPEDRVETGRQIREATGVSPSTDCWACHR
ncbi:MAG: cytochrome c family protein [Acidobacteriota bacterium]|nr:cytochrome c family protein [Acidobacteriota bacterium]